MRIRRSKEEISKLVEEFRASGLTRAEYCRLSGLSLSTLGNYCRREQAGGFVRVKVEEPRMGHARLSVVLTAGRRIEIGTSFNEAELLRLIRVVEAA